MSLAIFDLDNTLLGGDSDYLWGQFLVERGLVEGEAYECENQRFYDQYRAGTLDIHEFLAFMLRPLAQNPLVELLDWRARFIEAKIRPILLPQATALVERHRDAGDTLLIITATNRFITEPIAELLGVPHLLATEPEFADGRYTGRPVGIPCFQHGKVERLDAWLVETGHDLAGSWFYSDSRNDLPLLSRVTYPVAVDPDDVLARHAREHGWPIRSLRGA
ncbi:MAG: HAD family hydrolase [Candidatus Contendobacter sp.]